jgi:hypothetical protein
VAANALVVVGVDVASRRGFGLGHLEHGHLGAIDHAVVALETLTATHAALGLGNGLGFQQRLQAFFKIVQGLFSRQ